MTGADFNTASKTPQELGQELLAELRRSNCNEQKALDFIAQGATPNEKDNDGWTPLIWAAWYGRTDTIRALLDRGAMIDEKDNDGWTPLIWAAWYGRTDTVRALLHHGASIDEKSNNGNTALDLARDGNHFEVASLLEAEPERRQLIKESAEREHEDWVRAGMPVNRIKPLAPLKLKKKPCALQAQ